MYIIDHILTKERTVSMKNFIKKFSTIVLSVAMLMTSGVILPSVSAAGFTPALEGAKWTSGDIITVSFMDNVALADDAKDKIVLADYADEFPLSASDEVTLDGSKKLKIKIANGYDRKYAKVKFKPGVLNSAMERLQLQASR